MHLLSQGPTQLAGPAAVPLVTGGLLPDPGSMVASMGELLVARSLKVAAVLLGAVVLNRLVRWLLRRLVRGLNTDTSSSRWSRCGPRRHVPCSPPPIRCPACAARNGPR